MSNRPYRQITELRVRGDECDATRAATTGRLFALTDEARFDLYEALAARGVALPKKHAAKAETLQILRAPRTREAIVIEAWVGRVGTTSIDIAHRMRDSQGAILVETVTTAVALGPDGPIAFDESFRRHAHEPLSIGPGRPAEPDGSVAFLRTVDALPWHENQGGHVARTRMVDWLVDGIRVGAKKGAFEHAGANEARTVQSLSIVYERESFAGDGLRIAVSSHSDRVFDAVLSRSGAVIARARIVAAPAR